MRIAVAGGTGTAGRHVVAHAQRSGHDVVVLSRSRGVDVRSGEGLSDAHAGVDVVVDCLDAGANDEAAATAFFTEAAATLQRVGAERGVRHVVALSIVGVDRVPFGYYKVKNRVEEIVEDGGVPWTILRATQFHEFVATLLDYLSRGPVAVAPAGVSDQPIDVREVAARLAGLVDAGPSGRVEDLGGPQVLTTTELMRTYLAGTGRRRPVWTVPVPGLGGFRTGDHLTPEHADGRLTFADWLRARRG
jgi:uncharacterized protein YbjT (DUF2867 family)